MKNIISKEQGFYSEQGDGTTDNLIIDAGPVIIFGTLNLNNISINEALDILFATQTEQNLSSYRECEYVPGKIWPQKMTWYENNTKIIKRVDKEFVYGDAFKPVPTQVIMRLYDGTVMNNVRKTIIDSINYSPSNKIFEISRNRIVI